MAEKSYICTSITIMTSDRSMIAPGTPFEGNRLNEVTLKSMIKNKTIVEIDTNKPIPVIKQSPIGKSFTGPKEGVKATAIDSTKVGLTRKVPETITPELLAEKKKIRKSLIALGAALPPHNCRLDTLKSRLTEAEKAAKEAEEKAKQKTIPDSVWDGDPEELKDVSEEILLTIYRTRCEQYGLTLEKFDTVELLREKLSSEFVSSKGNTG